MHAREDNGRRRRWLIASSAGLLVIMTATLVSFSKKEVFGKEMLLGNRSPAQYPESHQTPPSIAALGKSKPHTTKLEWQQGWQPNGWQLDDGDWPDEGGQFSEGQTFPEDPTSFKIHQVYEYIPGRKKISKAEANSYWTELQKQYFRQTPSRTTYPAVPVIFDEDSNGGHSVVEPLRHTDDDVFVNSAGYPRPPLQFQSTTSGKSAVLENQRLGEELAEVEKEIPDSDFLSEGKPDTFPDGNLSQKDAGESEDWKEVLFMQGTLYEMQQKLAQQQAENFVLRQKLSALKAKATKRSAKSDHPKKFVTISDSENQAEQKQIQEMKSLIVGIQKQQAKTESENSQLRQQLIAIKKLTIKKEWIENPEHHRTLADRHSIAQSNVPGEESMDAVQNIGVLKRRANVDREGSASASQSSNSSTESHSEATAMEPQAGSSTKKAVRSTVQGTPAHGVASLPSKSNNMSSAVAFRSSSVAVKDAVVRALAADEESSIASDTDAIFDGSPTDTAAGGSTGRDGFDRLHSLERSALQGKGHTR